MSLEFVDNAAELAKRRASEATQVLDKKRIRPRIEWVLIQKVEPKDILHASGVLETRQQARTQLGRVIDVAPKITDLKPGDLVIYTNFPMELEDVEVLTGMDNLHLIMNEEVYAVIEDVPDAEI